MLVAAGALVDRAAEELAWGEPGQAQAFTAQVRLVGVAGVGGDARELLAAARGRKGASEPQDARQPLRAVPDRRADAPARRRSLTYSSPASARTGAP